MALTSKQRAALRSAANTMDPVYQIGKGEIDDTLKQGIADCIAARELIKVKVLENSEYSAREAADRGAGEILFTSMDHDGTRGGYPCDTFAQLSLLPVPVIASGGAGTADHIADVLTLGRADAALAASIFHYNEIPIPVLKRELKKRNINVRL